jgi:hypothetical protein
MFEWQWKKSKHNLDARNHSRKNLLKFKCEVNKFRVKTDLGPTLHGQKFTIAREQFEEPCKNQCQQLASFLIPRLKHFKEQINRIVLIGESSKLYLVG